MFVFVFGLSREYLSCMKLYQRRVWTCKVSGKSNLTYEEAIVSEQKANEKVQQFPKEFMGPVLHMVQFSLFTPLLTPFLILQIRIGCGCSCSFIHLHNHILPIPCDHSSVCVRDISVSRAHGCRHSAGRELTVGDIVQAKLEVAFAEGSPKLEFDVGCSLLPSQITCQKTTYFQLTVTTFFVCKKRLNASRAYGCVVQGRSSWLQSAKKSSWLQSAWKSSWLCSQKGIPKLEFDVVAPCTFTITCKKIYCQSL